MAHHIVDVEIHRHVVAEMQHVGEAQRREVVVRIAYLTIGQRQRGNFRVGGGDDDDVAGVLA